MTKDTSTEADANTRPIDPKDLPDYAPIPKAAFGPALNEHGYQVGQVDKNLYWVSDNIYMSAFLLTSDGVVLFDTPPNIGHNLQRAVDEIAAANGTSNKVTHIIYSHHHADHTGASSLFGKDVVRIGHERTRELMLRENDPERPAPEKTFKDHLALEIGGEHIELDWHGTGHSPDNIYIHFPNHNTLMLVDIVNPGWAPIYQSNLTEDVQGYLAAPDIALGYKWDYFIGGHLGRLGTRKDVELHKQYMDDVVESARKALATVNPGPYFGRYPENVWAGVRAYLDTVTAATAEPVIEKYTGVLGAADVYTASTAFHVMQSLRLDLGVGTQVHP